jgi:hypothetical protein
MKRIAIAVYLGICAVTSAIAENADRRFEDQLQFELFYEFSYRINIVESFLLECTGDRGVSYKFAFSTAPISNSYKSEIMGVSGISPDVFTNKSLSKRLWDEVETTVTRNHENMGDLAEPVLMAQKDVLRLMDRFRSEKNVLCDFVFWEEVSKLEGVANELMRDVKVRKRGTRELKAFENHIQSGLATMTRLFNANPLRQSK